MCEFDLPSYRCSVTGDFCRQLAVFDYLSCASREIGFQLFDYSCFFSFVEQKFYPKPPPPEFDFDRDIYLEPPF